VGELPHDVNRKPISALSLRLGLERDRSHGAYVDAGSALLARSDCFLVQPIEADHRIKTSPGEIHLGPAFLCLANTNTQSAQNAPVGVVTNEGMIFHNGGFFEILLKTLWFQTHAKESGHVLKCAFLVCGTGSAIHMMDREQKPKSAPLQASDAGRVGLDDHWTSDFDGASGNRFSIDFNEAQPARGLRMLHALKIAEVRDINVVTEAGFKQEGSLLDFKLLVIYDDLYHEGLCLTPLSRAFNHRSQVRGGDPSDRTVLCRAGNHAFPAFDAQALVHRFLAIFCGENRFHRTAPDAGVTATGALIKVDIIGGQGPAHS